MYRCFHFLLLVIDGHCWLRPLDIVDYTKSIVEPAFKGMWENLSGNLILIKKKNKGTLGRNSMPIQVQGTVVFGCVLWKVCILLLFVWFSWLLGLPTAYLLLWHPGTPVCWLGLPWLFIFIWKSIFRVLLPSVSVWTTVGGGIKKASFELVTFTF